MMPTPQVNKRPLIRYSDGGGISRKADEVASYGRYGDTTLVHMTPSEVSGLASLGELTINPETGLPEAFSLKAALPMIGGIAASFLLPMAAPAIFGAAGALGGGIGSGMLASGLGTFVGSIAGGQNFGQAALAGIMGGITNAGVQGISSAMSGAAAGAGADAVAGAASNVVNSGVTAAVDQGVSMAGLELGVNAPELIPSVFDGVSAAYPAATVPSSGVMDWALKNPLKTVAGGAGIAGLAGLFGGDEEYPEEEPVEIKPLPQFERVGGDRIARNYTQEELVKLYTDGTLDDPEREKLLKYHTDSKFNLIGPDDPNYASTSEVKFANTGGLLSLNNNDASQSSAISNFLQQGNNNADSEQGIFDAMFNMGASVAGKANDKEESNVVGPVVVSSGVQQSPAALVTASQGVADDNNNSTATAPAVVEDVVKAPDTVGDITNNDDGDGDAGDDDGGQGGGGNDNDSEGVKEGGLISLKNADRRHLQRRADGGIVSLAEGERPRPKSNTAFNLEDFNSLVKLGVGYPELERMLNGETAASKSIAKRLIATNPDSGAVGIFQFIPKVAKELGTSTAKIKKMTVKEQSDLYAKYLKRWKYKPGIPLGMMQAAPAYANKPNDFVAYKKGSRAFEQNPGWIGDDGKITAGSIKRYYNKDNDIEQIKEEQTITGRPSPQQPIVQQQQARPRPKDKPIPPERPSPQQPIVQQQQEEGGGFLEGLQTLMMGNDTQETVNKGDTLTALAKKYRMPLEKLLEANPKISNPNEIQPGQKIYRPDNSSFLERARGFIPLSEGGTLEQYYQGQVIGRGDGMSDEILFDVEGENPDMALLSRDEYVIPADVVSMIGNGSSNAGAEQLDSFLKNVRNESFGTTKQQKQMTNPQRGLSALM